MTAKTLSLITAAAIAAGSAAAHASDIAAPIPLAHSYADLLEPIPNAVERLKAADSQAAPEEGRLVEAQYYPQGSGSAYHHHHHHHHHHSRRWYMRHGYFWNGGQWMLRPIHHHHHHHHHSSY